VHNATFSAWVSPWLPAGVEIHSAGSYYTAQSEHDAPIRLLSKHEEQLPSSVVLSYIRAKGVPLWGLEHHNLASLRCEHPLC